MCSYLDKDTFAKLGRKIVASVNGGTYDDCDIAVRSQSTTGTLTGWVVQLDMSSRYTSAAEFTALYGAGVTTTTRHGVQVFTKDKTSQGCLRAFNLPGGGPTLITTARSGSVSTCAPAAAALDAEISTAQSDRQLDLELPPTSIARVDLCTKLGPAAVKMLGAGTTVQRGGAHHCQWIGPTRSAGTILVSLAATDFPGFIGAKPELSRIGNHPTALAVSTHGSTKFAQMNIDLGTAPVDTSGLKDVVSVMLGTTSGQVQARSDVIALVTAVAQLKLT